MCVAMVTSDGLELGELVLLKLLYSNLRNNFPCYKI